MLNIECETLQGAAFYVRRPEDARVWDYQLVTITLRPNESVRTSLAVRVGVDFAHQEAVLVQQRSGRFQAVGQGLPAAAHPLHGAGGGGFAQAVPELRERLPQLLLVTMETHTGTQESVIVSAGHKRTCPLSRRNRCHTLAAKPSVTSVTSRSMRPH